MKVIIDEVNDCSKKLMSYVTSSINTQEILAFNVQNQILVLSQCNKYAHTPILLLRHYCRFRVTSALVLGQIWRQREERFVKQTYECNQRLKVYQIDGDNVKTF